MPYIPIIQPGQTFLQRWQAIDSKFETSIETIDIDIATSKLKIYKFDGTSILSTNAIPYPVTGGTNGVNKVGNNILLGGTLTGGTTINTSTYNFLVQNGIGAQRLRITNTFAELAGALELRIAPPSIDASTASVGDLLQVVDDNTGECDYGIIKDTHFTSLSIVSNKVRLTFKDASFIESGIINTLAQTNTAINYAVVDDDTVIVATAAPITITLPIAPINGRQLTIKSNGVATGGNPITVNGNGKNIDAAATNVITTSYGFINIVFNTALNKWLTI